MRGVLLFLPLAGIFLIMLAAAVAIVIHGVIRRRRWVAQPSCAKCRYAVEGLDALRCPECGADLRAVGILTPGAVRPLGPRTCFVAWSLALPLPAFIAASLIWAFLPSTYVSSARLQLSPTDPAAPYEHAAVELTGDGSVVDRDHDRAVVTLTLVDGTTTSPLEVDLDTFRYRVPGADGSRRSSEHALDAAEVQRWMASVLGPGPDPGPTSSAGAAPAAEATELLAQLDAMARGGTVATGPAYTAATYSGSVTMITHAWFWPTAAVAWLAAWLGGGAVITRLARRRATP